MGDQTIRRKVRIIFPLKCFMVVERLVLINLFCVRRRLDKPAILPVTRQSTGKLPPSRQHDLVSNATIGNKTVMLTGRSPDEIKQNMEEQLKMQRVAVNQKRALENRGKYTNDYSIDRVSILITTGVLSSLSNYT